MRDGVRALQPPPIRIPMQTAATKPITPREERLRCLRAIAFAVIFFGVGAITFARPHDELETVFASVPIVMGSAFLAVAIARAMRGFDRMA